MDLTVPIHLCNPPPPLPLLLSGMHVGDSAVHCVLDTGLQINSFPIKEHTGEYGISLREERFI